MRLASFAGLLTICAAACADTAETAAPDWLTGYWLSCEGGRQTAVVWLGGGGDALLVGVNLNGPILKDSAPKQAFEFMRMTEVEGKLAFIAMPNSAAETVFPLKSMAGQRAVFENPTHDFPQRVIYERDGDALKARIEGSVAGEQESMDWTFRAAPVGENCPSQ
jgi:hypothetical protein